MRRVLALAAGLATASAAQAQDDERIDFEGHEWRAEARVAEIVEHLGREALHYRDGIVWLEGGDFFTGEIEFDLALIGQPGHSGVVWRAVDDRNWEKVYFRHHLSGKPDSFQYTPAFDGDTGWQIYSDARYQGAVDHYREEWMHVRLAVAGDSADVYLDGELVFHIADLLRDPASGAIGFWQVSAGSGSSAFISNVEARPGPPPEIVGEAVEIDAPDVSGLIETWSVSDEIAEDALSGTTLDADLYAARAWTTLPVEANGIANLARVSDLGEGNTVLARAVLNADAAQDVMMSFGYSDRARVYLDGDLLFTGDNFWASRDYRYLGTVTRHVAVPLRLEAGENELVIAVSETFGGWGVTAALENADGVGVRP